MTNAELEGEPAIKIAGCPADHSPLTVFVAAKHRTVVNDAPKHVAMVVRTLSATPPSPPEHMFATRLLVTSEKGQSV